VQIKAAANGKNGSLSVETTSIDRNVWKVVTGI
jgi:hypothetical protein